MWVDGCLVVVHLDYSSVPFLRFPMSFEFLSEMFDHSVSETRYTRLTIKKFEQRGAGAKLDNITSVQNYSWWSCIMYNSQPKVNKS